MKKCYYLFVLPTQNENCLDLNEMRHLTSKDESNPKISMAGLRKVV